MSDVAIRPAAPDEYDKIGALREAAYTHDYQVSDQYRASLRDVVEHVIALAAERGLTRVVLNSGPQMTTAHRLYSAMGFTRLRDRETRIVDGHTEPLLAFGFEVGDGTRL
jgi:hypothetical protein